MGRFAGLGSRLFFRLIVVVMVAGVVAGISWAVASNTVAGVLGSPPPEMGNSATTFLYKGVTSIKGLPKAWRFTYFGTHIPGTPNVRFYVSPLGKLLKVEPPDLADRLKLWQKSKGFN